MPKNSLSNKRKVDELSANETCDESDDAKLAMSQAGNEPLKKSRKMTTSKPRALLPSSIDPTTETDNVFAAGTVNETSAAHETETSNESNEAVFNVLVPATNNVPSRSPAKRSPPKKRKIGQSDAYKDRSPDTRESPQDSIIGANELPTEEFKKPVAKPKKRSPLKRTTKEVVSKKKKGTARGMSSSSPSPPPSPPRPAAINKQVSNKVKQVLLFINSEQEKDSSLDRGPENQDYISVPWSSLVSAIMRMQAHYEIDESVDTCIDDVGDIVVKHFKRDIGQQPNVDWVTIDASRVSTFEDAIQDKIARHGLEDVNLLEIELETFTKDLLENTHLFRDANGQRIADDQPLRAMDNAAEAAASKNGDDRVSTEQDTHAEQSESSTTLEGGSE